MRMGSGRYKNIPAVILENEDLRVVVLDQYGGKIASIYDKEQECELLVQNPGREYRVLTEEGSYVDAECSGFDDMFPTVDTCMADGRAYPDHGEVCRRAWKMERDSEWLEMSIDGKTFPFCLSKRMRLNGRNLEIHYRLEGDIDKWPSLWAGHIMFTAEPGDRVCSTFCGEKNKMFGQYPEQAVDEPAYVKLTEEIANYKFYYTQSSECFEVSVERDGCTRFSLEALGEALWLGIWVNQKGFHDQYCLALEPATAPNDAPAPIAENGKKCALTAKEWMLKIKVREAE